LLIVAPVRQPFWPQSGGNSTYPAVQFSRASSHYAVGLSDAPGYASIGTTTIGNLGRTELNLNDSSGNIRLVTGNEILRNIKVDFIKIDTEGMELKVLKGLSDTIKRDHPTLFVEVDDDNTEEFANFIEYHGYSIKERYR
jgi:hypothetical protein